MARKKTEEKGEKMEATAKPAAQTRRTLDHRAGPFWRAAQGSWVAKLGGKQYKAPATIGQTNVEGARKWYEKLATSLGFGVEDPLPGNATPAGLRKLWVTLTRDSAAELAELAPIVAAERMAATRNYSQTISVAVREALAARKAKGRK
jgi:hypothetical protein